jgi:urease gamma subunit
MAAVSDGREPTLVMTVRDVPPVALLMATGRKVVTVEAVINNVG